MSNPIQILSQDLKKYFGKKLIKSSVQFHELTITVAASSILDVLKNLRDRKEFDFKQLIDLCGVDYLEYPKGSTNNKRFAVVYHLLSLKKNQRIRVRAFLEDDNFPIIDTITNLWPASDWYEREAFDLFGIMFLDHPDLRRILTDYGFVGHPFRKDFPMIGKVEMRYDPTQKRVVYEPVSIEERNNAPRVINGEGSRNG